MQRLQLLVPRALLMKTNTDDLGIAPHLAYLAPVLGLRYPLLGHPENYMASSQTPTAWTGWLFRPDGFIDVALLHCSRRQNDFSSGGPDPGRFLLLWQNRRYVFVISVCLGMMWFNMLFSCSCLCLNVCMCVYVYFCACEVVFCILLFHDQMAGLLALRHAGVGERYVDGDYLDQHNVAELFADLLSQLVQTQPDNPVQTRDHV
jgi:hypothetical protein